MRQYPIVIVDDEETIRKLLQARFEREGFQVRVAAHAGEAESLLEKEEIGVMVTDLKMPGKDGFTLMKESKEKYPRLKVIVITGHGEKAAAIEALRCGASNYLEKPFDMDEITHSLRGAMKEYLLERENQELVSRLEARVERVEGKSEDQYWFVSKAQKMQPVNEWLSILRRESMRGDAEEPTVLITGESGTGKEGIARMIHAGSRRGKGPWVAVNCANFNEQLLDSELFGHEKGAFTGASALKRGLFEIAKGGTLFLDELGEMDVKLQSKLLRVLQEKVFRRVGGTADIESEVRVIAATNRNLDLQVKAGAFREDLYHRISRVVIELPALRDRNEDVIPMAKLFAERAFHSRGKVFEGFTSDAETSLMAYPWPGNVRELLNVVERGALVWQGSGKMGTEVLSLPQTRSSVKKGVSLRDLNATQESYSALKKKWVDSFEKEYLISVLNRHSGNVSAAAREAKLDRSNFLRLLRRHGLIAQEFRKVA